MPAAVQRTDDDRRTLLRLNALRGEQSRLDNQRQELRRQLIGLACNAGVAKQDDRVQLLKAQIRTASERWQLVIDEIGACHELRRSEPVDQSARVGECLSSPGGCVADQVEHRSRCRCSRRRSARQLASAVAELTRAREDYRGWQRVVERLR